MLKAMKPSDRADQAPADRRRDRSGGTDRDQAQCQERGQRHAPGDAIHAVQHVERVDQRDAGDDRERNSQRCRG